MDTQYKIPVCTENGCAELHVQRRTLVGITLNGLYTLAEQAAADAGLLLGEYDREQLHQTIRELRKEALAGRLEKHTRKGR